MIAQAGGLTYTFPARQIGEQQPVAGGQAPMQAQQGGSPFDIPLAEDGVPTIENYTRNYYDSYGRLKDFTETMWKDYGVDVTKPDFSQPGGGLLHEAFQKMDADLRIAANDLAESKTILAEQRKAELEMKAMKAPGYDPYAQIAREAPNAMIPLGLFEDVQQAIQGVSNRVYNTPGEVQRAYATLQPLIQKYEKLMTDDPRNAAVYQRQIDAMRQPTYSTPDIAFRPPSGGGSGAEGLVDLSKKVVFDNTAYGWTPQRVQPKTVNGKATLTMTPEQDITHGKVKVEIVDASGKKKEIDTMLTVDYYYMTPDGTVMARYKSPADDPAYDRRVDNKLASEQMKQYLSNDAQFAKWSTATAGLRSGETGGVPVEKLLSPQELQAGEMQKNTLVQKAKQLDFALNNEKDRIKAEMTAYNDLVFNIGGKDYRFINNIFGDKYYLEGGQATAKQLTGVDMPKTQAGIKYENMTADDIFKILENYGYFDKVLQSSNQTTTGATGNDINQRIQSY